MIHQCYTIGQCDRGQLGVGKGLLGDLGDLDALLEYYTLQAAFGKYAGAHSLKTLGQDHGSQLLRACKGILLHHRQFRTSGEGQRGNIRVSKSFTADEGHTRRNGNGCQITVGKRFCLNGGQGIRQDNGLHRAVLKSTAADDGNGRAKVQLGQINVGFLTVVLQDGDRTTFQNGILPVAFLLHGGDTGVVALGAVIPVFVQVSRQGFIYEVQINILRCQEGVATDVLNILGDGQFCQGLTAIEGITANIGHGLRQIQHGQAFAESESEIVHIG